MEIRIYDQNMNFKGLTENQVSVVWHRRYGAVGDFNMIVPNTEYNMSLFKIGNIVWMKGANEAGVIEDLLHTQNNIENRTFVSGRFLESYMDRRIIYPRINFTGTVEAAMRKILQDATAIPRVVIGQMQNLPETVSFQATCKNLLTYEEKLAKGAGYGFRFRPDFTNKTITFEVYVGKDRTARQNERTRVEFSAAYNNVNEIQVEVSDQLYKNVAYVGGEGEGDARVYVVTGDTSSTGLDRREVFVDARDLTSEGLSTTQYRNNLIQRGKELLDESIRSEYLEFVTEASGNFKYKEHYDLGDIVTVKHALFGVQSNMRISGISEVYEYGVMQVLLTLGTPLPEKIDWEDR